MRLEIHDTTIMTKLILRLKPISMRKKLYLSLLCALTFGAQAWAAETDIVVQFNDNTTVRYALDKTFLMAHRNGNVVFYTTGGGQEVNVSYPLSTVKKYVFAPSDPTAVDEVRGEEMVVTQPGEGVYRFSGLSAADRIGVVAADGRSLKGCVTRQGDSATVSLAALPKGVYIVTVNNRQTIKIAKQ